MNRLISFILLVTLMMVSSTSMAGIVQLKLAAGVNDFTWHREVAHSQIDPADYAHYCVWNSDYNDYMDHAVPLGPQAICSHYAQDIKFYAENLDMINTQLLNKINTFAQVDRVNASKFAQRY